MIANQLIPIIGKKNDRLAPIINKATGLVGNPSSLKLGKYFPLFAKKCRINKYTGKTDTMNTNTDTKLAGISGEIILSKNPPTLNTNQNITR